jgi:hypothetical protein
MQYTGAFRRVLRDGQHQTRLEHERLCARFGVSGLE